MGKLKYVKLFENFKNYILPSVSEVNNILKNPILIGSGGNANVYELNDEYENLNEPQKPQLNIGVVICSACGAGNSIRWEKKSIGIDDKQGSYKDLTFDFCEECGDVTNFDFS
jgi:hypothetical protein